MGSTPQRFGGQAPPGSLPEQPPPSEHVQLPSNWHSRGPVGDQTDEPKLERFTRAYIRSALYNGVLCGRSLPLAAELRLTDSARRRGGKPGGGKQRRRRSESSGKGSETRRRIKVFEVKEPRDLLTASEGSGFLVGPLPPDSTGRQ